MSTNSFKRLLLVEDNPGDARLLREMFDARDAHTRELTHVQSVTGAEQHPAEHGVDVLLLDLGPGAHVLKAGRWARAAAPHSLLVVRPGVGNEWPGVAMCHRVWRSSFFRQEAP